MTTHEGQMMCKTCGQWMPRNSAHDCPGLVMAPTRPTTPAILYDETKWIIMSKDRKWVAKGTPRSRYLIPVDDAKDTKRLLTYSSKSKAENAFHTDGFYSHSDRLSLINLFTPEEREAFLEAVKVHVAVEIVE